MNALRARLRPRDKDIKRAIESLSLEQGELSDLIRDGIRKVLIEKGVLPIKELRGTIVEHCETSNINNGTSVELSGTSLPEISDSIPQAGSKEKTIRKLAARTKQATSPNKESMTKLKMP